MKHSARVLKWLHINRALGVKVNGNIHEFYTR